MPLRFSGFFAALLLVCAPVQADVLTVPDAEAAATLDMVLPTKGMRMADVEKKFGAPKQKFGAVGGAPRQPPISRWDYENFVVMFEYDHVIDAVIPDAPAPIYNKDQLETAP